MHRASGCWWWLRRPPPRRLLAPEHGVQPRPGRGGRPSWRGGGGGGNGRGRVCGGWHRRETRPWIPPRRAAVQGVGGQCVVAGCAACGPPCGRARPAAPAAVRGAHAPGPAGARASRGGHSEPLPLVGGREGRRATRAPPGAIVRCRTALVVLGAAPARRARALRGLPHLRPGRHPCHLPRPAHAQRFLATRGRGQLAHRRLPRAPHARLPEPSYRHRHVRGLRPSGSAGGAHLRRALRSAPCGPADVAVVATARAGGASWPASSATQPTRAPPHPSTSACARPRRGRHDPPLLH
mmetsp:Transcript_429/g.1187  ORF Transcript_429/g.1187 Transcript_429/m.1187 type:complete len:295 (-) Transcript_429:808-1692(-)